MAVKCPIDGKEKDYYEECKNCDFYHPYYPCVYRKDAKMCPFDGRKCNSSAGFSSVYDCRHHYGFELRPPKCEEIL